MNAMKLFFIASFLCCSVAGFSQTVICEGDSLFRREVCLNVKSGSFEFTMFDGIEYNYVERDASGNYSVLGNVQENTPQGQWLFYMGDLNGDGEEDWFRGHAEKGILEGPWSYSFECVRIFERGIDHDPRLCPNR